MHCPDSRDERIASALLDNEPAPTFDLNEVERAALNRLRSEAAAFFERPLKHKRPHADPSALFGFRELGGEYSQTSERPDQNESFSLWGITAETVPGAEDIASLCDAVLKWRSLLGEHAKAIFAALATRLGGEPGPAFERASYVQINDYAKTPAGREFLQDAHEDGHLVTMQCADAPGLEVIDDDGCRLAVDVTESVVCMAGGLLTLMTGGLVRPRYHQVRNHGLTHRCSVMYFVNPEVDRPLTPWHITDVNRGVDLAAIARSNPAQFGLPPVPEL